ncbi:MAG: tRNA lysidine(34) synthetase TilS [Ruminococcaceae bacterium]|nr:tRNA lysidine(34) synthetase TilS [Oscillospiraceae bacterium]
MKKIFPASFKKVLNNIQNSGLLEKGDRVLLALSGGADSVYLLLVLLEIKDILGIEICAAHLNHGIRGEEADRDELFSRQLCERFQVRFVSERVNVPEEMKKTGEGCEECARRLRYSFLERSAKALECNKIATAHHADDNIETVLLHMIRGCAISGLTGIKPIRGNVVRPLLCVGKAEILAALEEKGETFVTDSTNASDDMTRNFIRHNILPKIYELNPKADGAVLKMCRALSEDSEYLDSETAKLPRDMSREELKRLPSALFSRYIIRRHAESFSSAGGDTPMLDGRSLERIKSALYGNGTVRIDVQGGVTAYIDSKGIAFEERKKEEEKSFFQELDFGENIISSNGYKILITMEKKVAEEWINIYKLSILMSLNSDKILKSGKLRISVRQRQEGDSYVFGGHRRDVRRQMINFKIPQRKRASLPVFCSGGEIFWIPGLPLSDGFRAKKGDGVIYIAVAE